LTADSCLQLTTVLARRRTQPAIRAGTWLRRAWRAVCLN